MGSKKVKYNSIDLFSGCGGLTQGLKRAAFDTKLAVEVDMTAARTFKMNHPHTHVIAKDIRSIDADEITGILNGSPLHLLAGCPPCQGFSSVRRLNREGCVSDQRNTLVLEFLRFVLELRPYTIMMENVPGLVDYDLFHQMVRELEGVGYNLDFRVVNVKNYGVPQSRERLVLVGSRIGVINIALANRRRATVRSRIGSLERPEVSDDELHKITTLHTQRIKEMISLIPKNGGSRKDLPEEYTLECHKKEGIGFNDIYGRLRWDDVSTTITGGCLNASKGRFLHPEEDRVLSPREAALLQSFPKNYKFPVDIPKADLALLIGNALPPTFSYYQAKNIRNHLDLYFD
jgi:DNA (cytosine-5)-methyltransferase 1